MLMERRATLTAACLQAQQCRTDAPFCFETATASHITHSPLQRDPYEQHMVCVAPSTIRDADEGLMNDLETCSHACRAVCMRECAGGHGAQLLSRRASAARGGGQPRLARQPEHHHP